jgi:deoxyribodipyrimidine photolyase-related protein
MECVAAAERAYKSGHAPLAAVEGFVRQIIGWREFVNGVYWLKMPDYLKSNGLTATRKLPAFFYTGETPMNCLRCVIHEVRDTAYNHHIQRLMILGNFLLLAGINPQEAHDWFLEMYIDAHEWVMAANVLGMALHADGGFMATKPYAGSAAYISKMSNYCSGCHFDPNKKSGTGACPFNLLYWDFYDRHADRFASNPRTSMMVSAWRKRPEAEQETIRREAAQFLAEL